MGLHKDAMSFQKRNVGLAGPSTRIPIQPGSPSSAKNVSTANIPGVRPSPLDGRPTTSTGTQSLDELLAGHAGFPLGNSLLIEENGTTDFAGALLRYYAAEGVVQGHAVHVVGVSEQWGRELPGLVGTAGGEVDKEKRVVMDKEKMKIAWRYERLGEFEAGGAGSRGGIAPTPSIHFRVYIRNQHSKKDLIRPSATRADDHSTSIAESQSQSTTSRTTRRRHPHGFLPQLRPDQASHSPHAFHH